MGADCHVAIEWKPREDYPWECWAINLPVSRDYVLFALLAKVRGQYTNSSDPRGIPNDVSPEVKEWFDTSGFHSHSWLTPVEFYTTCVSYEQSIKNDGYDDYTLSEEWQSLAEVILVLSKHFGVNHVRIVFAFDS